MDYIISILAASLLVSPGLPVPLNEQATAISHESPLQVSEPDQLDLYIELLAHKESSGKEDVQIIDTNGRWSRGALQYQDRTFQHFSKKYDVEGDIMDPTVQRKLTRLILTHEKNGWKHWFNSVKKIGRLPPV